MAYLNTNGLERLWQHIIAKLGDKVNAEDGKGLSTNDFTDAEKTKLAGIANGANKVSAVSELTNDVGFITGYTETDPTVPSWAKAANKPSYTASEVGADASGTASSAVSAHNTNTSAHSDIRAKLLPSVTASDAGKFLCVNSSGAWAAQALENAEEVSF